MSVYIFSYFEIGYFTRGLVFKTIAKLLAVKGSKMIRIRVPWLNQAANMHFYSHLQHTSKEVEIYRGIFLAFILFS